MFVYTVASCSNLTFGDKTPLDLHKIYSYQTIPFIEQPA